MSAAPPGPERSGSALSHPAFRLLWITATVSFVGTFVQEIAERWLMLELTKSPLPSAMLATAFVTASLVAMLPAGVLADRMERRHLLLVSQLAQAATAAALAVVAWTGHVTPTVLLAGAACLGVALAIGTPAWGAFLPELIPRELVAEAVALNAVAFNIARAVGPAIGGVVLAEVGPAGSFAWNAVSFVAVALALVVIRPPFAEPRTPPPPLRRAFAEPLAHVAREPSLRGVFAAMLLFTFGAASVYALAPAFGKTTLQATPRQYGIMIGAMGGGAVVGAWFLKRLRERLAPRTLVTGTMLTYATCAIVLSRVPSIPLAIAVHVPAGVGWLGTFSCLTALAQVWAPDTLRGRVMALYTMVHFAMWAVGASVGGTIADRFGIRAAMLSGGAACSIAALVTSRLPLPRSFVGAASDPDTAAARARA